MFSTVQTDVIKSLIPVMRRQGYKYYIAYTYTRTGNYSTVDPDLYIVFSEDKITASDLYTYSVPSGSVKYSIRTPNYSTNSSAVNTDRLFSSSFSGSLTINPYEHIYTNSVFSGSSVQPDILYEMKGGYEFETSVATAILLAVFVLLVSFRWIIKIRSK